MVIEPGVEILGGVLDELADVVEARAFAPPAPVGKGLVGYAEVCRGCLRADEGLHGGLRVPHGCYGLCSHHAAVVEPVATSRAVS